MEQQICPVYASLNKHSGEKSFNRKFYILKKYLLNITENETVGRYMQSQFSPQLLVQIHTKCH
jgi:hypothetical protein